MYIDTKFPKYLATSYTTLAYIFKGGAGGGASPNPLQYAMFYVFSCSFRRLVKDNTEGLTSVMKTSNRTVNVARVLIGVL